MSDWTIVARIALLVPLALPAGAQPTSFRGPISGVIYTGASRSVRPVLGTPGSALAGPALVAGVEWASVAPGGKWALISRDGHPRLVQGLSDLAPAESSPQGLIDGVDRVAWSRDGAYALLYSSAGGQLQRLAASDRGAVADPPVSVPSLGHVTALAIGPGGGQIAFGTSGDAAAGVYLLQPGQAPTLLSPVAQPAALAFDETGNRLYAVDRETQRILEFDSGAGPFEFASLPQPDGQALDPVGLAICGGGRYLLLADSVNRAVRVYDTSPPRLLETVSLDFAPSRLEALSPAPLFLLNGDRANEWLMVLDARRKPIVYFVPAAGEEQQ